MHFGKHVGPAVWAGHEVRSRGVGIRRADTSRRYPRRTSAFGAGVEHGRSLGGPERPTPRNGPLSHSQATISSPGDVSSTYSSVVRSSVRPLGSTRGLASIEVDRQPRDGAGNRHLRGSAQTDVERDTSVAARRRAHREPELHLSEAGDLAGLGDRRCRLRRSLCRLSSGAPWCRHRPSLLCRASAHPLPSHSLERWALERLCLDVRRSIESSSHRSSNKRSDTDALLR